MFPIRKLLLRGITRLEAQLPVYCHLSVMFSCQYRFETNAIRLCEDVRAIYRKEMCVIRPGRGNSQLTSQCGAAAERRTRNQEVPGSKLANAIWFFPQARKLIGIARWPSSLGMLNGASLHHCSPIGRAPLHSSVKTSTWCVHWGRKLQSRQQSALSSGRFASSKSQGGYALHSVCPQLSFFSLPCLNQIKRLRPLGSEISDVNLKNAYQSQLGRRNLHMQI